MVTGFFTKVPNASYLMCLQDFWKWKKVSTFSSKKRWFLGCRLVRDFVRFAQKVTKSESACKKRWFLGSFFVGFFPKITNWSYLMILQDFWKSPLFSKNIFYSTCRFLLRKHPILVICCQKIVIPWFIWAHSWCKAACMPPLWVGAVILKKSWYLRWNKTPKYGSTAN